MKINKFERLLKARNMVGVRVVKIYWSKDEEYAKTGDEVKRNTLEKLYRKRFLGFTEE